MKYQASYDPNDLMIRMTDTEKKVAVHDKEIARLQSDYESEKGTRARSHAAIHERLDKIERIFWIGVGGLGGLGGLQVFLQVMKL